MMNGSRPESASMPLGFESQSGVKSGALSFTKSGMSSPVHSRFSASHHTSFFASDHGLPSGSAEARLYIVRRFAGHAKPHFRCVPGPSGPSGVRERALFSPSFGYTPQ